MVTPPRLRKLVLTVHLVFSVGWIGAVSAYLALGVSAVTSQDAQTVRAAWIAMKLTGWFVVVPLALASLVTGLVQSLGTKWGLFRHYWVLAKLLINVFATIVLLLYMQTLGSLAGVAAETTLSSADLREARISLVVHAGGGLLVLLVPMILSVYKPRGMTRYGRRKQHERRTESQP